jgi:glucose/arabinose dehydrogenase
LTLSNLPTGFSETIVVTGLSAPTAMDFAPDGRLFVLEQGGHVKLVHNDGTTWTALSLTTDSTGERGVLGIAFDPNFSSNHYVYIYYTNPNAGGAPWATGEHNQVSRFTVDDSNPQQPVFTNEAPILDLNNLVASNHNGGAIHFGKDGQPLRRDGHGHQSAHLRAGPAQSVHLRRAARHGGYLHQRRGREYLGRDRPERRRRQLRLERRQHRRVRPDSPRPGHLS